MVPSYTEKTKLNIVVKKEKIKIPSFYLLSLLKNDKDAQEIRIKGRSNTMEKVKLE